MKRSRWLIPVLILVIFSIPTHAEEKGFITILPRNTLQGWKAIPESTLSDWSIKDGILTGKGSANRLAYLIWDEKLEDFELTLEYRLKTKGNTGIELRSHPDPSGKRPLEGYHADFGHVGIGPNVLGAWDFHFAKRKEPPCPRGKRLVIGPDQKMTYTDIEDAVTLKDIKKRDWNQVHVLAKGNHLQFYLNGKLASEFVDNAKVGYLKSGWLGVQLHDKGMIVEFRNVRLKKK